ncbi:TPA: hypothetical protein U1C91_002208, partial [Streptococcus suis]|nr:hypothetical protein [Streptococcus suis]HEM3701228.1 hypothetical protein [Streptococcus suis]
IAKNKVILYGLLLLLSFGSVSTIHAQTRSFGTTRSGVKNTEKLYVGYTGEAWTYINGRASWIKYFRNGQYLGGAFASKDSWRDPNVRVYDSVWIWDSMNPYAKKTTYTYTY